MVGTKACDVGGERTDHLIAARSVNPYLITVFLNQGLVTVCVGEHVVVVFVEERVRDDALLRD